MAHPEAGRNPTPPSRSIRSTEVRRTNYEESAKTGHVYEAWSDGGADLTDEATAEWGPAAVMPGYERLHLHLDFVFGDGGNDITTVFIAAQASPNGKAADQHWYDVYADEAATGALVRKVWEISVAAVGPERVAWPDQLRVSRYMRFKVWANGTTRTDSRATLSAQRVMDSQ